MGHYYFIHLIGLIGDQNFQTAFLGILVYLLDPIYDGVESLPLGAVVHHDDTKCAFVVACCYGLKALLPSSIPQL